MIYLRYLEMEKADDLLLSEKEIERVRQNLEAATEPQFDDFDKARQTVLEELRAMYLD